MPVLDGQLESVEVHALAVLVDGPRGVVVEQDLQLGRGPRVVQQGRGEFLTLVAELLGKEERG